MTNRHKSEGAVILASLLMSLSSVLIKLISSHFTGIQISWMRFAMGLVIGLPSLLFFYKDRQPKNIPLLFWRGVTGAVSMILFYWAISLSSSGRAYLLLMTYPAWVAVFGGLFYKEKVTIVHILSMVLCIGGAAFVFYDGSHYGWQGDVLALLSSVVSGLGVNLVRRARQENNSVIVYLGACIVGVVVSTIAFPLGGMPQAGPILWVALAGIGTLVYGAKIVEMWAYRYITALRGSIITYFSIPMVLFFSVWLLKEELMPRLFLGTGLILLGLLLQLIPAWHPTESEGEQ